ncbi:hypothetical protein CAUPRSCDRAFT_11819 [Caulochytrium protostelioides]|uniref:Uncharacterized protein n=1 Tax=Caulochytrium protostelioides TaxID=1555241 RepID=A0A4P9WWF2_9FUNG|nr:hypothetical protein CAUPRSCDRAFT_11819 [Caulochytrium protostelioides]
MGIGLLFTTLGSVFTGPGAISPEPAALKSVSSPVATTAPVPTKCAQAQGTVVSSSPTPSLVPETAPSASTSAPSAGVMLRANASATSLADLEDEIVEDFASDLDSNASSEVYSLLDEMDDHVEALFPRQDQDFRDGCAATSASDEVSVAIGSLPGVQKMHRPRRRRLGRRR